MAANALLLPRKRGMRAAASATFVAAMAACALVVVVFSTADRAELVSAGGGGYALPPGYEANGKDLETRDHSRWWDHSAPSSQRKPAHPAPAPAGDARTVVKTERLPKEMLDAMVCVWSPRVDGRNGANLANGVDRCTVDVDKSGCHCHQCVRAA
jgi:hypothetical protein